MAVIGQRPSGGVTRRGVLALTVVALVACVGVLAALGGWPSIGRRAGAPDLAAIELDVARRWPEVSQLPREQMSAILAASGDGAVLFDVREADEYTVSHLPGAVRVDPGVTREEFLARHGAALSGKTAVFYCSVGVRSSLLADRVREGLSRAGAAGVYNLRGGVFAWHNEARPLVDGQGPTDRVHGYDARWGKLVQRQDKVRQ